MSWSARARGSLQAEPIPWVARGCSAAGSCGEPSDLPVGRTCHTLHTLLDTSLRGCVLGRAFLHYPVPGGNERCAGTQAEGKSAHPCSREGQSCAAPTGT